MPRPPRRDIVAPGNVYHIYARGNDRMTLFHEPADFEFYLGVINKQKTPHGVLLYHYDLMPNHIHLILQLSENNLSAFMHTLQFRFAKRYCQKTGFVGHVWQGRFKSRLIDNDVYLFTCGNYIEMNPVRAGLVADPGDWPYSSYRAYAYGESDRLIDIDPLYSSLGRTESERQNEYRRIAPLTRSAPA